MNKGTIGVSFDGLRLGTARDFNNFAEDLEILLNDISKRSGYDDIAESLVEQFNKLCNDLWIFMCLFDDEGSSFRDLSDEVKLKRIDFEAANDD